MKVDICTGSILNNSFGCYQMVCKDYSDYGVCVCLCVSGEGDLWLRVCVRVLPQFSKSVASGMYMREKMVGGVCVWGWRGGVCVCVCMFFLVNIVCVCAVEKFEGGTVCVCIQWTGISAYGLSCSSVWASNRAPAYLCVARTHTQHTHSELVTITKRVMMTIFC